MSNADKVHAELPTHAIVVEAPSSTAPWTRLFALESFRYAGTGWWLDAVLPHGPRAFLASVVGLPIALWAVGSLVAPDPTLYLGNHDVSGQVLFLAVHMVVIRLLGSLFARGIGPSLSGIGVGEADAAWFRRGLFGPLSNLGALASAAVWIFRDCWKGLIPGTDGLTAFDDPGQWDMAGLGVVLQRALLSVWVVEWAIFGMLLWVQAWSMLGLSSIIRRTDFKPHLVRLMVRNEYRDFFALIAKNATVCAGFALANLAFIAFTGELAPKPERVVSDVFEFVQEMSDLTSVGVLFAAIIGGYVGYVFLIRGALTRAIDDAYAPAGDALLEISVKPLALTGDQAPEEALGQLQARLNATVALVRGIAFQREVDALGGRGLTTIMVKALPVLGTIALRVYRMTAG